MVAYKASGYVLGKLWGSGVGGYPANDVKADSLAELDQQIKDGISDGSLDSGMGFESLIGAMMVIETIDSRIIDNKEFIAKEYEDKIYGDLSDEQIEHLTEAVIYNS